MSSDTGEKEAKGLLRLPGLSEIKKSCQRLWERGELLRALFRGATDPFVLPLPRIPSRTLLDRFGEVQDWSRSLAAAAREGSSFRIEWRTVAHRQLGQQRLPGAVVFADATECLRFLGREKASARFLAAARKAVEAFPETAGWILERPLELYDCQEEIDALLTVLRHFRESSPDGRYLRQLDIPGVDTKFVEGRKALISGLLDRILPLGRVRQEHSGARGFAARYGLADKPPLLRFRLLDPGLFIGGYSDLGVRVSEFSANRLPVRRVFVVENEVNGLALPDMQESLVIFGSGYAVDRLFAVSWLSEVEIFYWGDLDTHGFAILDRIRSGLPAVGSFLMDRETLLSHRELWVEEPTPFEGELSHLHPSEQEAYRTLREHVRGGRGVRLEQERIPYWRVLGALEGIVGL